MFSSEAYKIGVGKYQWNWCDIGTSYLLNWRFPRRRITNSYFPSLYLDDILSPSTNWGFKQVHDQGNHPLDKVNRFWRPRVNKQGLLFVVKGLNTRWAPYKKKWAMSGSQSPRLFYSLQPAILKGKPYRKLLKLLSKCEGYTDSYCNQQSHSDWKYNHGYVWVNKR